VLSKFYVSNKETLRHTYAKSCSYMLIMAFPLAVGGFLVSDQVILSIYGEQFRNTISVFRVMVWITMFNFVGYVNGATLNATGKEKMFAFMTGCATISNIFLNYIFITKFGYLGACYSTLLLTFLGFVIYSAICHKRLNVKPEWQVIAKSMLAVLIMACVVFLLQKTPLNVFIVIPLGGISYFVMIFLLRIIPKEDAAAIMSVFKRYDKIQVDAGQSLTDR
jgi:O-antigen/teichoic acid export membrane protein